MTKHDTDGEGRHGTPLATGLPPGPPEGDITPLLTRGKRRQAALDPLRPLPPATLTNWEDIYSHRFAATKAQAENADFKAGMDEADHIFRDLLRNELIRRALLPTSEPIMYRGTKVGDKLTWDNRLLLAVSIRYLKDELHLPSKMEVTGSTDVHFVFDAGETRDDEPELIAEDADYEEVETAELEPGQDD